MATDSEKKILTIKQSESIEAPRDEVWSFISNPANEVVWQRSVLHVAGTPDDARSVRKMMGRRVEAKGRLEIDPDGCTLAFEGAYTTSEGPKHLRIQTTIEGDDSERSRVVGVVTVDAGIFGQGAEHFDEVVRHEMEINHINLKHIMEAHEDVHTGFSKLPSHS